MPRGRPRKQPQPLDRQIAIHLTDQEHTAFCQLAASRFQTRAELARELIHTELANKNGAGTSQPHPYHTPTAGDSQPSGPPELPSG